MSIHFGLACNKAWKPNYKIQRGVLQWGTLIPTLGKVHGNGFYLTLRGPDKTGKKSTSRIEIRWWPFRVSTWEWTKVDGLKRLLGLPLDIESNSGVQRNGRINSETMILTQGNYYSVVPFTDQRVKKGCIWMEEKVATLWSI